MGFLDKIKEFFSGLRRKVKIKRITHVGPTQAEKLNKDREKQIGYIQADKELEKAKRKKAEEELVKKEEVDVTKALSQRELDLISDDYRGAFSFKKLFDYADNGGRVKVTSWDGSRIFGTFQDIAMLRDGRLAIVTKERDIPVITGRTMRDLIYYHPGLSNTVAQDLMFVALNERGRRMDNFLTKEVPDVMLNAEGKIEIADSNIEPLQNLLEKKNQTIIELENELKTNQKQLQDEYEKRRELKRRVEYNVTRAESAEGKTEKMEEEIEELTRKYHDAQREIAKLSQIRKILEDHRTQLESAKKEWMEKVRKAFPQEAEDRAEEKIKENFDYLSGHLTRMIKKLKKTEEEEVPAVEEM